MANNKHGHNKIATKPTLAIALIFYFCFTFCFAKHAQAETKIIDDVELNYSVFNSSFLTPRVASIYEFTRAYDRALINISVLENTDPPQKTLAATITGTSFDLIHKKELAFKEIREGESVYYIAEFPIDHRTTYYFDLKISVNGKSYPLQFNKLLYVENK